MKLLNILQGWKAYTPDCTAEVSLNSEDIATIKNTLIKLGGKDEMIAQFENIEKAISEEAKRLKD